MNEYNKPDTLIKLSNEFWTRTYETNIGKLIGICYRYTGNHQLSEDLTHDAFLKAIEKAGSFRGDGNFDAWLRRIVVNHVLQYLREQKKHPYPQQLTPDQATAISERENTSSTHSMEFTTTELLETIDQLPEHHRLVFNLYVMEKFSHAQIGEELGISEGTSKSHLARARKKLQQLLTEKIETKKEKDKERAAIILFALTDETRMDEMFVERFDQFSIPPEKPLSLSFHQHFSKGIFKKIVSKKSLPVIISSSTLIAITLVVIFYQKVYTHKENKMNNNASVAALSDNDSTLHAKNKENIQPQAATILPDSVNTDRNKKLNTMKPLDSLALMLVLSSGTVNAASVKDSITNQIHRADAAMPATIDTIHYNDQTKSAIIPQADRAEKGTFRASELYWNKDNLGLDFKGNVRVDFKEQHFQGKGTFNFLGQVHLLVIDGQQAALGKTTRLLEQDYNLTVLNSTEAISKYGDIGKNGAILIYKSN